MDLALLHTEKVIDQSRQVISSDSNTEEANESIDEDGEASHDVSILTDASKTDSANTPTDKGNDFLPSRQFIKYRAYCYIIIIM